MLDIGPFSALFPEAPSDSPRYLDLLTLKSQRADAAVLATRAAVGADYPADWINALLAERGWRRHLVAAAAIVLVPRDGAHIDFDSLWARIDLGSWVLPQLIAAAAITDPGFESRAIERIRTFCESTPARPTSPKDWLGDWVYGQRLAQYRASTGWVWSRAHSRVPEPKLLPALFAMGCAYGGVAALAKRIEHEPKTRTLLNMDRDNAGDIAAQWKDRMSRYRAEGVSCDDL